MRSDSEIRLLKIKQRLLDSMIAIKSSKVVNFAAFNLIQAKLEVCEELLVICRKQSLKLASSNTKGIKCD